MRPERDFSNARPLAQHCDALLGANGAPADPMPVLARGAERLCEDLAERLARLAGGMPVRLSCGEAEIVKAAALPSRIPGAAVHTLFAPAGGRPLQVSFPGVPLLMLVDLAFGGRGTLAGPAPEAMPHSALVFAGKIEAMIAAALGQAFTQAGPFEARRRDTAIRRLEAFAPEIPVALIEIKLELGDGEPASIHLALPQAGLAALCGIGSAPAPASARTAADPAAAPFADIPIELGARLVDARLSAAKIGGLQPGSVLPLAIARRVPLRIGERVIAWGSLGSLDDCTALQIIELA